MVRTTCINTPPIGYIKYSFKVTGTHVYSDNSKLIHAALIPPSLYHIFNAHHKSELCDSVLAVPLSQGDGNQGGGGGGQIKGEKG